ncbi:hypothetical protein M8494_02940 [Serratia ureilytica]
MHISMRFKDRTSHNEVRAAWPIFLLIARFSPGAGNYSLPDRGVGDFSLPVEQYPNLAPPNVRISATYQVLRRKRWKTPLPKSLNRI